MKKTKFKVDILKKGIELENLIAMIANHNPDYRRINSDVICGYLLAKAAINPKHLCSTFSIPVDDLNTLLISDDNGKTNYLSITEIEVEELVMDEQD